MALEVAQNQYVLPVTAISRIDIGRLYRETKGLDEFLSQSALRAPGSAVKLPKTSKHLDEIIETNKLNVLDTAERGALVAFLEQVYQHAPLLHISFSADPSARFMQDLTVWLRREIHPLVLVQVGLQPNIGAGCVVRTTNKYFDFSLRSRFKSRKHILLERLKGVTV